MISFHFVAAPPPLVGGGSARLEDGEGVGVMDRPTPSISYIRVLEISLTIKPEGN